jgi:hypothetical protein
MQFQPSEFSLVQSNPANLSGTLPTDIPGVYMKSGVVLNESMKGFLRTLQPKLGFDIVVTSGTRTVDSQASAMMNKLRTQGPGGILNLYGQKDLAQEVVDAGTLSKIKSVLAAQVSRGRYISRHMRGDALDFRVTGLSGSERGKLVSTAGSMVGSRNVIDEGDHIHVEDLGPEWAKLAEFAADNWVWIAGALSLTAMGVAAAWVLTKKGR